MGMCAFFRPVHMRMQREWGPGSVTGLPGPHGINASTHSDTITALSSIKKMRHLQRERDSIG